MMKHTWFLRGLASLCLTAPLSAPAAAAPGEPAPRTSKLRLKATGELGFLGVASHIVQFSEDASRIDYVDEGGQDVLFPFQRWSLELAMPGGHHVILLYQPLELATREQLSRDIVVDELTFPAGTTVDFFYGFPFWRASYLYDFIDDPHHELSFGGSLQIRDATITFTSVDGALFRANRGVGPVPILKLRWRYDFPCGAWLGSEVDGFYAPVSVINGSDNEVTGAIVDANLRAGLNLPRDVEVFLNLRYLGGGAVGTSDDDGPGDGYTKNWLHFLTASVGFGLTIF